MAFYENVKVRRVVELKSTDKTGAIGELSRALCKALHVRKHKQIVEEIQKREDAASTYIGQGVALPHARVAIEPEFAIAVGRTPTGIPFDAARGAQAQIVVLLLEREDADSAKHLQILAEMASFFKSSTVRERLLSAAAPVDLQKMFAAERVAAGAEPSPRRTRKPKSAINPVFAAASKLAVDIKAKSVIVFSDTAQENDFLEQVRSPGKLLVVTSNKSRFEPVSKRIKAVIQAPSFPTSRTGQIKIGILLALSRGLISRDDKVVCLTGNSKNGFFDTIVALDVAAEYEFFWSSSSQNILPPDIKPEVLERVLSIAGEIALEGREGKPIGTIFVVGDTNTVNQFVRQLIINPFRGYSESERSFLDPGLDETIKEFAGIDGAFVITGDGIILSAGSYLRPQAVDIPDLPSGFGARHAAAAGITASTNSLAVCVSESTGMVTVFKNGVIMMTLSKPVVQERNMVPKVV
jgi:diadenylate cyclase